MPVAAKPLPYDFADLEPHISAESLQAHYAKYYLSCVETLNGLTAETELENLSLESILDRTWEDGERSRIYGAAAEVRNHEFFWNSMTPDGGGIPEAELRHRIEADIGGRDEIVHQMTDAALQQGSSGWIWLVLEKDVLRILSTPNFTTACENGQIPLLACDLCEHAYFVDFQSERSRYIRTFVDDLANWDFAARNLWGATTAHLARHMLV